MTSFFYCLLRRLVSKAYLPSEGDWKSLHEFNFTGKSLLGLSVFMRKTQLRNSTVRVRKVTLEVEREKSKKKGGADAVKLAVVYETLNSFSDSARIYLKFVCERILSHRTRKSDLVKNLGCFN